MQFLFAGVVPLFEANNKSFNASEYKLCFTMLRLTRNTHRKGEQWTSAIRVITANKSSSSPRGERDGYILSRYRCLKINLRFLQVEYFTVVLDG